MGISCSVVEEQGSFALEFARIKGIFHQNEDVYVVRFTLGTNPRSKNDQTRNLICSPGHLYNPSEPFAELATTRILSTKTR